MLGRSRCIGHADQEGRHGGVDLDAQIPNPLGIGTRVCLSSAELAAVTTLMGRIPTMADPYDGSSRVPVNLPSLRSKVTNSCPALPLSARIMQSAKSAPAVR